MTFDPTITLGSLISAIVMLLVAIAGWVAFRARVDTVLTNQADLMTQLSNRLERHEARDEELFDDVKTRIGDLAGAVQRLVGQSEVWRRESRS